MQAVRWDREDREYPYRLHDLFPLRRSRGAYLPQLPRHRRNLRGSLKVGFTFRATRSPRETSRSIHSSTRSTVCLQKSMATAYRRSQWNPFSKRLCLLAVPTNWPGKPVGNMPAAIQPTIREKTFNHNSMRYSTINRRENERSLGRRPRGFAETQLGNCYNCQRPPHDSPLSFTSTAISMSFSAWDLPVTVDSRELL